MIQIEITSAIALYSMILCLLILVVWLYTEFQVRRPQRYLGTQFLWHCTYCSYTYLDEGADRLSKCPRCQSYNDLEEGRAEVERQTRPGKARDASSAEERTGGHKHSKHKRPHQRRRGPRRRR